MLRTLTKHPATSGLPLTGELMLLLMFFMLGTGVLAKVHSWYNNKTWEAQHCCTQGFIGTGENQQQCLWTITNQLAKG